MFRRSRVNLPKQVGKAQTAPGRLRSHEHVACEGMKSVSDCAYVRQRDVCLVEPDHQPVVDALLHSIEAGLVQEPMNSADEPFLDLFRCGRGKERPQRTGWERALASSRPESAPPFQDWFGQCAKLQGPRLLRTAHCGATLSVAASSPARDPRQSGQAVLRATGWRLDRHSGGASAIALSISKNPAGATDARRAVMLLINAAIPQRAAHDSGQRSIASKLAPDWHQPLPESKKVSRRSPADSCITWLPDLGSNQGPTD